MQRWEYDFLHSDVSSGRDKKEFLEELDKKGQEGWEAVGWAIEPIGRLTYAYVLLKRKAKRRKE